MRSHGVTCHPAEVTFAPIPIDSVTSFHAGSAVSRHPSAANPQVLQHAIALSAGARSSPLSGTCRQRYGAAVADALGDRSRLVNRLLCNGTLCPRVGAGAPPGAGVPVNESAIVQRYFVFAAIDTAAIAAADAVSFDVVPSTVRVPATRQLCASLTTRYDTIRDAVLTCARKPTWVSLIYRTEPTTKKCKNREKN